MKTLRIGSGAGYSGDRIEPAVELAELGDDMKQFVRKSPGVAIGIAAVAGFAIAKMLSGGGSDD